MRGKYCVNIWWLPTAIINNTCYLLVIVSNITPQVQHSISFKLQKIIFDYDVTKKGVKMVSHWCPTMLWEWVYILQKNHKGSTFCKKVPKGSTFCKIFHFSLFLHFFSSFSNLAQVEQGKLPLDLGWNLFYKVYR